MNAQTIIEQEAAYIAPTYTRPDIVFSHGDGIYIYDTDGKQYLDMTAGIAVVSIGHSDPDWVAAVTDQTTKLVHVSNLYHTAPAVALAKRLVEHSFADKVYFSNSGAEANEGAIKFARKYQYAHGRPEKRDIVYFSGAFHGRTMGALAVTPREKYQKPFKPLMPQTHMGIYNDVDSATDLINSNSCAVIVEPIQGEGGIVPATQPFMTRLRELCDHHDAILIFDEVQCGLGRTGSLWAHDAYDIQPDMMSLAKPLANGLPIGATLMNEKVAAFIQPGDHASTFAGGAAVCAGANVVFDKVNQHSFLTHVQEMGAYLCDQLATKLPSDKIRDIRGRGLIIGLELSEPVAPIVAYARDHGVLLVGAGENVLRFVPPLIINKTEINQVVDTIAAVL